MRIIYFLFALLIVALGLGSCGSSPNYKPQLKKIDSLQKEIKIFNDNIKSIDSIKVEETIIEIKALEKKFAALDSSKLTKKVYIKWSESTCLKGKFKKYKYQLPQAYKTLNTTAKRLDHLKHDLKKNLLKAESDTSLVSLENLADFYVHTEEQEIVTLKKKFAKRIIGVQSCLLAYEVNKPYLDSLVNALSK